MEIPTQKITNLKDTYLLAFLLVIIAIFKGINFLIEIILQDKRIVLSSYLKFYIEQKHTLEQIPERKPFNPDDKHRYLEKARAELRSQPTLLTFKPLIKT